MDEKIAISVRRRRKDLIDSYADATIPHTVEDMMAVEPNFEMAMAGPHVPHFFKRTRLRGSESTDDECYHLLEDENPVDPSLSWFQRTKNSLKGDFTSILLLLFLYLLQGIPLGLISAIPLVLSSKNASYGDQAVFSFAYWPFSVKLLWAPIVDSFYWRWLGRRKSWMIPCQYLIGLFMLFLSYKVNDFLGENSAEPKPPSVLFLMLVFLPLNFLAATQDIAVDGWALTMLSRKNVGYASTCNAAGQTTGFFLGSVLYLTLDSPNFANQFFRKEPKPYGLVSLSGFVFFWGIVFLITTTLVLLFKKEVDHSAVKEKNSDNDYHDDELELGIFETYAILWKIIRLKPMIWMVIVLLTGKIAFAATDGITNLKLIQFGMPKDKLSSMALFLTPVQVFFPWIIGKWTAGNRPLNIFLLAYPYRLFMAGVYAALLWWTPSFKTSEGDYPLILYAIWIVASCFHQIATHSMAVAMMAFNAQISDPKIGGTYMTLLNTLNNLGGNWPVTVVLSLTDHLTFKKCFMKETRTFLYSCSDKAVMEKCTSAGNLCEISVDGYYIVVALCTVIGVIWYKLFFKKVKYFQRIPRLDWRVISK